MKCMKWMLWHESIDMNELKGMNSTEWTKRMNWNERIQIKNLTWMKWLEANELKELNCQKCSEPLSFLRFLSEMELSLQSRAHFVDLIFKKWSETVSFFYDFMWSTTWWRCDWHMKSSSRYSLAHILSTSSSKSAKKTSSFFLRFVCEIELSLQSRAHFVDRIFIQ